MTSELGSQEVVILEYQDLVNNKDLSKEIETAFGFNGLGVLAVRGVPEFPEKRKNLLPFARKFAVLPNETKLKYEHPLSFYSFGWSHGKEKFAGSPDLAKGSYYANPQYDRPFNDEKLIEKYPTFIHPNIWPDQDLPGFSNAFKECGRLIVSVGELIAKHCDKYVKSKFETYEEGRLFRIVHESKTCKARLLHYFDSSSGESKRDDSRVDSWCGWHNDHSSLTGLCPGMILDKYGNETTSTDPSAGLYVRTRTGKTLKAVLPTDCMIFQIGETAQVHSGGLLQATPHCVMAGNTSGITRESFAVFMGPDWSERMNVPTNVDPSNAQMGSKTEYLPPGIPLLEKRWNNEMDFAEFTEKTLSSYYNY